MAISLGVTSNLTIDQNLAVGGSATITSGLTLSSTTASSLLYGNTLKAVSSVILSSNLSLTTGTLALAAALTGVNSVTAATSTALTLTGGSSGASLVLGQGATAGAATLTATGTGTVVAATAAASRTAFDISNTSTGPTKNGFRILGANASNADSRQWSFTANDFAYGDLSIRQSSAAATDPISGTSALYISAARNLLIGGTTDIAGSGGLKVFGSTAATSYLTGSLQSLGGAGINGAVWADGTAASTLTGSGLVVRGGNTTFSTNIAEFRIFGGTTATTAIAGDGSVRAFANVAATNTTTGSIVVGGGIGVSGAGYFGSGITSTASGDSSIQLTSTAATPAAQTWQWRIDSATGNMRAYDVTGSFYPLVIKQRSVGNSDIQVASTTASTTTTSGALQVAGGVGVVKSINVGERVAAQDFVIGTTATGASMSGSLNARNTRNGLAFNGGGAGKVQSTLTGQNIGTDPFSLVLTFIVPTSFTTQPLLARLSSDASGSGSIGNALTVYFASDGSLVYHFRNAAHDGYIQGSYVMSGYSGEPVNVVATRNGTTFSLYINGVAVTPTVSSAGTSVLFSQSITSTYLAIGAYIYGADTIFSNVYSASLYNLPLAQADVAEIMELGGAVPKRFKFGSQTPVYSSDFSAGSDGWFNGGNSTTVTGNIDGIGGQDNNLRASGVLATVQSNSLLTGGGARAIRWTGSIYRPSSVPGTSVYLMDSDGSAANAIANTGTLTANAWTNFDVFGVLKYGSGYGNMIMQTIAPASGVSVDIYFRSIKFYYVGAVVHLPFNEGAGPIAYDSSSNSLNATISNRDIAWAEQNKRIVLGEDAIVSSIISADSAGGITLTPYTDQPVRAAGNLWFNTATNIPIVLSHVSVGAATGASENLLSFGNAARSGVLRGNQSGSNIAMWSFSYGSSGPTYLEGVRVTAGLSLANTYLNVYGTAAATSTTSGALQVAGGAGFAKAIYVNQNTFIDGAAGTFRSLQYTAANVNRWGIGASNAAESGSNVGSDLIFNRWSDAGADLGTVLTLTRSTGAATFTGQVTISSAAPYQLLTATAGTNYAYTEYINTGNNLRIGLENSAGASIVPGAPAYAAFIASVGARSLVFATNNIVRQTIDSAGATTFTSAVTINSGGLYAMGAASTFDANAVATDLVLTLRTLTAGSASSRSTITNKAASGLIEFNSDAGSNGSGNGYDFKVRGVSRLSIDSVGAATFVGAVTIGGNLTLPAAPAAGNRYILTGTSNTGTGQLTIQAGGGSTSWGGTLNLFETAHATKGGWVGVGLGVSGAKFTVNSAGFSESGEVASIDRTGAATFAGALSTNGLFSVTGSVTETSVATAKVGANALGGIPRLNLINPANTVNGKYGDLINTSASGNGALQFRFIDDAITVATPVFSITGRQGATDSFVTAPGTGTHTFGTTNTVTMTAGVLTATSAGANGLIVRPANGNALAIFDASAGGADANAYFTVQTSGAARWYFGQSISALSGDFEIYSVPLAASALKLAKATGAATFAGTLATGGAASIGVAVSTGLGFNVNLNPGTLTYGAANAWIGARIRPARAATTGNAFAISGQLEVTSGTQTSGATFISEAPSGTITNHTYFYANSSGSRIAPTGNYSFYAESAAGPAYIGNATASTLTTNGALIVAGGVGIAGQLNVGSSAQVIATSSSRYGLTLTHTWNNAVTAYEGLSISVTDTASAATSVLARFTGAFGNGMTLSNAGNLAVTSQITINNQNGYVLSLVNTAGGASFRDATFAGTVTTLGRILTIGTIRTAAYTVTTSDHVVICNNATTPFTVTLIAASTNTGRTFIFKNKNVATVTLDATSLGTIDGSNTWALTQNQSVTVVSDGTRWNII